MVMMWTLASLLPYFLSSNFLASLSSLLTHPPSPGTYLRQKPGIILKQKLAELTVAEVVDTVSSQHTHVVVSCQAVTVPTALPVEEHRAGVTNELCLHKILMVKS